jgi:YhcH/YjgK/YiaL family protein
MKNLILVAMVLTGLFGLTGSTSSQDPSTWSKEEVDSWFSKKEWLNGWNVNPDLSINKRQFAISYYKNKKRWEKAFDFLKTTDLSKLEVRRYDIDGDNLFALVSEYMTKNEDAANFEAHRKYIDIQYLISGSEIMNVAPYSTVNKILTPYDGEKDIEFIAVGKAVNHRADQKNFFIFFPDDAHRPGMKDGTNAQVRKVVLKLKVD